MNDKNELDVADALKHSLRHNGAVGHFKLQVVVPEGVFNATTVSIQQDLNQTQIYGLDESRNFIQITLPVGAQSDPHEQDFDITPHGGNGATVYLSFRSRSGDAREGKVEGAWIGNGHVKVSGLRFKGVGNRLPFEVSAGSANIRNA